MAILKNIEGWWFKLNPEKPDKYDPKKPNWNFQARTTSKEQRAEWLAHNCKVKAVREDPEDEESKILYYKTSFSKRLTNKEGKALPPVSIISSKGDIDPDTLGNGSIVNIRIFEYDYVFEGKEGKSNMLQSIQLVKHVLYTPEPGEDFEEEVETETVDAAPRDPDAPPRTPKAPGGGAPKAPVAEDSEY